MSTITARGNIVKPADSEAADNDVINANYDQISLYGMGPYVCTSGTRPADKWVGTYIYETDTKKIYMWDGTNYVKQGGPVSTLKNAKALSMKTLGTTLSPASTVDLIGAGAEQTAAQFTLTDTTNITFTAAFVYYGPGGGAACACNVGLLVDGTLDTSNVYLVHTGTGAQSDYGKPFVFKEVVQLAPGTHNLNARFTYEGGAAMSFKDSSYSIRG